MAEQHPGIVFLLRNEVIFDPVEPFDVLREQDRPFPVVFQPVFGKVFPEPVPVRDVEVQIGVDAVFLELVKEVVEFVELIRGELVMPGLVLPDALRRLAFVDMVNAHDVDAQGGEAPGQPFGAGMIRKGFGMGEIRAQEADAASIGVHDMALAVDGQASVPTGRCRVECGDVRHAFVRRIIAHREGDVGGAERIILRGRDLPAVFGALFGLPLEFDLCGAAPVAGCGCIPDSGRLMDCGWWMDFPAACRAGCPVADAADEK